MCSAANVDASNSLLRMSTNEPPPVPDPWQQPGDGAPTPPGGGYPPPPPVPPPPPPGPPPGGYSPPGYQPSAGGYPPPYPMPPRNSGKAIAILVLGVAGLVFTCTSGFGVIAAIVALALAPGANREIAASGGTLTGEGLIKAGVICSWIAVGLTALGILVLVLFIIGAASSSAATSHVGDVVSHNGAGVVAVAGLLPQWRRVISARGSARAEENS